LAKRLSQHLPLVRAGSSIKAIIAAVFEEQSTLINCPAGSGNSGPSQHGYSSARRQAAISPDEARILTNTIRAQFDRCWLLLVEAHERRVWKALGYKSWTAYARIELELSRSRSYELLSYCRITRELMTVAGTFSVPKISPYAASQIKTAMREVSGKIRGRVEPQHTDSKRVAIVEAVVRELRQTSAGANWAKRQAIVTQPEPASDLYKGQVGPSGRELDADSLYEAIDFLAALPDLDVLRHEVTDLNSARLIGLHRAVNWLLRLEFERTGTRQTPIREARRQLETAIA
jgi:hypothetical protein